MNTFSTSGMVMSFFKTDYWIFKFLTEAVPAIRYNLAHSSQGFSLLSGLGPFSKYWI